MKYPSITRRAMLLATLCALLQHGGSAQAAQSVEAALIAGMRPVVSGQSRRRRRAASRADGRARRKERIGRSSTPAVADDAPAKRRARHRRRIDPDDSRHEAERTAHHLQRQLWCESVSSIRAGDVLRRVVSGQAFLARDQVGGRGTGRSDLRRFCAANGAARGCRNSPRTRCRRRRRTSKTLLRFREDHANRLQADLDVARTQQAKVNDYQRQTLGEALALHAEKERAQAQLRQVQSEIMQLQRQSEVGLPASKQPQ